MGRLTLNMLHGIVCLGRTDKKVGDQYLYKLICPYCSSEFESISTNLKPRTGRKQGKNHCGCQTRIRRNTRQGHSPSNKIDDRTRTLNEVEKAYKGGAKLRNLEYGLSREYLELLVLSCCFYCGEPPNRVFNLGQGRWVRDSIPVGGIDRIDSSKGYTDQNVVPCCAACNYFKSARNQGEFLSLISKIYQNIYGVN